MDILQQSNPSQSTSVMSSSSIPVMQSSNISAFSPVMINSTSSTGSVVDQISSFLQQRALSQDTNNVLKQISTNIPPVLPFLSPAVSEQFNSALSPAGSSTTSNSSSNGEGVKRVGSPLNCEVDFKKVKKDAKDDCDSDTESSEQGNADDSQQMSPLMSSLLLKPKHLITPEDVFMSVPGRLSLLTSSNRYKVTIGEVQRRLNPPENLNASILGAILRRAKSKNGGKELRAILEYHGMTLPAGRRKSTQITLFTSMIEGEAEHLAKDFDYVCNHEFPSVQLGQLMVKRNQEVEAENIEKRKEKLRNALEIMNEYSSMVYEDSMNKDATTRNTDNFQLLTHNFGIPALLSSIGTFNKFVTAQLEVLQPPPPPPPPVEQKPVLQVQQLELIKRLIQSDNKSNVALQTLLHMCQQNNLM